MCWSWQVSLIFSLFEWICIIYLIHRNKLLDRWLALYQAPIAAQEFLQFLLWAFAIDENTTLESCSSLNKSLSYILSYTVMLIPCIGSFMCFYTTIDLPDNLFSKASFTRKHWRIWILFTIFIYQVLHYIVVALLFPLHDIYGPDVHCTAVGDEGHQAWGLMNVEGYLFGKFTQASYVLPALSSMIFRPWWLMSFPGLYGLLSAILTLFVFTSEDDQSGEWGSLWCWANSFVCIWSLATYFIGAKIYEKYGENENETMKGCCIRFMFLGTANINNRSESEVEMASHIESNQNQDTKDGNVPV